ncbi:hypothetical protein DPMN_033472 [Dreissena polymorpha]|uniref:Uncharacterized protein n=1 Tax=Dreissena polymorpha TaxID=45954 RepID=A0A9D4M3V2_DREPO|nr:hypothetical protein DPMN_033472 [Dreissena polymorpha]
MRAGWLAGWLAGWRNKLVFRRKKLVIRLANAGGLAGWLAGWLAGGRNKLPVRTAKSQLYVPSFVSLWRLQSSLSETGYIVEPYPANDIAILRLENSAFLPNYNRHVCLPSPLLPVGGVSHVTSLSTVYDANVDAEC